MRIYKEGNNIVLDMQGDITFYKNDFAIDVSEEIHNITLRYATYRHVGDWGSKYRVVRFLKSLPALWSFVNE